ncbi:MAG: lytic murein transglycosylase [Archangium sp.]|nr:lytic murein transglycosylase [Archangium sp.]
MSAWLMLGAVLSAADGGATVADAGRIDAGVALTADAGVSDGGVAATWRLSQKLGKGKPEREAIIAELTRKGGGVGETELTRAEAEAILDDPRAELIYGDKTISIVAPSMLTRQRQGHLDLMAKFLQPERVEAGAAFKKEKETILEATEKKTGVDREVIIGILMWESKLGTITGDWVAFNALASQAFFIDEANTEALRSTDEKALLTVALPKKKKGEKLTEEELAKVAAAREELVKKQQARVESIRSRGRKNFLSLLRQCKTRGIDVFTMKGSWAGALGFPQFMPASLRWAEDGNGDGAIDLFQMDDAIASVGKYLQAAGFKKSARDAVYDYNHEQAYVDGVLAFAAALKNGLDAGVPVSKDAGP